jgi:5'-nucleotidase
MLKRDSDGSGTYENDGGADGEGADAGEGTDFHAVRAGYAAVTPLAVDLTRHAALHDVRQWLPEA